MRAAIFQGAKRIDVADVPAGSVGTRDVLLAVEACGVCGSDLASYEHGHYVTTGQVMGHEISARVVAVGRDVRGLEPGVQVAVRPMGTCGVCGYCRAGASNLCGSTQGRSLGYGLPGGFAEEILLSDVEVGRDVVPVEVHVPPTELVWAEPLAVAVHAIGLVTRRPVESLLVVGAGSVGLCVTAAALAMGIDDVVVLEPREHRRDAAAALGTRALAPGDLDPNEAVGGAVDTSGIPQVISNAAERVRPGGTVALLGLGDGRVPWPVGGVQLTGSFAYTDEEFRRAVDLIVSGRVRLGRFVTHRFSLEQTAAALGVATLDETAVKAVVIPEASDADR